MESKFMEYLLEDPTNPAGTLRVMHGMCLSFFGDIVKHLAPKCPKETLEVIDQFIGSLQEMKKVIEKRTEKGEKPLEIDGYEYVGDVSFEDVLNLSPEEVAAKLPDEVSEEDRIAVANGMKKVSDLIKRIEDCDSEEEQDALLAQLQGAFGNDTKH